MMGIVRRTWPRRLKSVLTAPRVVPRRPSLPAVNASGRWCKISWRKNYSPEQISARLKIGFPDDPEMRCPTRRSIRPSRSTAVARCARDLHQCLRTGRALRKARRTIGEGRGKFPAMLSISERLPEVEARAVPGHWESQWSCQAAIGTLEALGSI